MQCQECGEAKARYEHPDYGYSDEPQLCAACAESILENKIDELRCEIEGYEEDLKMIGERRKVGAKLSAAKKKAGSRKKPGKTRRQF